MKQNNAEIECYRVDTGIMASDKSFGNNGYFSIPYGNKFGGLDVICSDGEGWDHVSVSLPERCPTWDEMVYVKDIFFGAEETVMQLHPPKSQYVNLHEFCLHLWRKHGFEIPLPPKEFVGA